MEELFRFVVVRPPLELEKATTISLRQESELQKALDDASKAESPRENIIPAATAYADGKDFVASDDKLYYGSSLRALDADLDPDVDLDFETLQATVSKQFSKQLGDIIASEEWQTDLSRLRDSILAIKFLRREHIRPLAALVQALRLMQLVERVAQQDSGLREKGAIREALRATVLMPVLEIPKHKRRQPPLPLPEPDDERLEKLKHAQEQEAKLGKALDELLAVPSSWVKSNEENSQKPDAKRAAPNRDKKSADGDREVVEHAAPVDSEATGKSARRGLTLKGDALHNLSQATQLLLEERGIDITKESLESIIYHLHYERRMISNEITYLTVDPPTTNIVLIGGTAFKVYEQPLQFEGKLDLSEVSAVNVPTTFGDLQPAGVADLLIVKQQLVRYEGRDVAHVENILRSESKTREHRRKRTSEEFFLQELETQREEERDLQTTERFEIGREASETIRLEMEMETGVNVSAQYGSLVEVEANARVAISQAREVSRRQSTEFSREIVDKIVSKYSEKIREQRSLRLVEEVEETNSHGFDNTAGDGHVVGIYQWLDKVYEAQVFNYGLRSMYDLVVPEPAAFLIEAFKSDPGEDAGLVKPEPFTLKPNEISDVDYDTYVARYQASNVNPPPEPFVTVAQTFSGGPSQSEEEGRFVSTADIVLPEGYEAYEGSALVTFSKWATEAHIDAIIGRELHRFSDMDESVEWQTALSNEVGSIPVAVRAPRMHDYVTAVQITCRLTSTAREKWRLETHAAIQQAYQQRLAEYEEKLSQLLAQAAATIQGRNPGYNKRLIADELKKAAISIMTQQNFDIFDGIEPGTNTLPQVDLAVAEDQGAYIRFFEQAFEWNNMTYVFYPYFWGRKTEWLERLRYDDPDPLFINFIKAGAARIVVPARPGFESAIDHFMTTGEVWNGGELPDITDPAYLPIVEEIKNQLGAPTNELPWGEPWMVHVPTSLVSLRPDDSLPVWVKTEEGEWLPQELVEDGDDQ